MGVIHQMEHHQDRVSLSSLKELINGLKNLIVLQSSKTGNPWISIHDLTDLFYQKYQVSPEEVAKEQGYRDDLRSLFIKSRCFSIYSTQMPQEFYVALLAVVVPNYNPNQTRPIQYRIKREWKADGRLIRMLQAEGAEEILFQRPQSSNSRRKILEYQPILPEIKSVDDLKTALMEIIKSLTIKRPKQLVTVATLSKKFRDYYGQPMRTIVRSVCPNTRLIDLLQSMPNLYVQEVVANDWQITLKVDSLNED